MNILNLISCLLSFVGCSFVVISYLIHKRLRTNFGTFSLWLAICGIGNSMYPFLGTHNEKHSAACILQAAVGSYFVLCSLFTSTILTSIIFGLFNQNTSERLTSRISIQCYHYTYAWGLSLILTVIPLFTHSYSLEDGHR
jgi:hypothetical protein